MSEILISADSHVSEDGALWTKRLPAQFSAVAPQFGTRGENAGTGRFEQKTGGWDPSARLKEMEQDGVSAEVLYPTLGLRLFGLEDAALQEACFRVYNDWIIDYCAVAPERLVGVPCISMYDINHAVAELERCKQNNLRGALIWQAPHPDLPLYSEHYEPFWAAAQDLEMPVNLHILTGFNYSRELGRKGTEAYRGSVNLKAFDAINGLFDLIFYGVLDRYPRLKIVIVENEIGWIPFFLQQWDYYFRRHRAANPPAIEHEPSFYFNRQVFITFFDDAVGAKNFGWGWGVDNCMWSNDYPHPNSTWPNSRQVIERDLGHLPADVRQKLVYDNVSQLYGLRVLAAV